jgi:hypothetical protein
MVATVDDTHTVVAEGLLSEDECDLLIEQTRGRTVEVHGPGVTDTAIRTPKGLHYPRWNWHCVVHAHAVDSLDELHGIDLRIRALFADVNRLLGWNVPIDVLRFGISNYPAGDRMGPHVDDEAREEPPWDLPHRGISLSVQLSDPSTYEGGGLRVYDRNEGWWLPSAGRPRGTAILFGSSTLHEVTEVSSGERWALLAWGYTDHFQSRLK